MCVSRAQGWQPGQAGEEAGGVGGAGHVTLQRPGTLSALPSPFVWKHSRDDLSGVGPGLLVAALPEVAVGGGRSSWHSSLASTRAPWPGPSFPGRCCLVASEAHVGSHKAGQQPRFPPHVFPMSRACPETTMGQSWSTPEHGQSASPWLQKATRLPPVMGKPRHGNGRNRDLCFAV